MGNVFDCETNALDPEHFPKDGSDADIVVDPRAQFSKSRLWQVQERFYHSVGRNAWNQAIVPHMMSSNAFVARAYARVLVAFLRDLFLLPSDGSPPRADPSEPVYIVELGSGHGKLGFLIMEMLKEFADAVPTCATENAYPFVLVLTDVAEDNVEAIEERAMMQHYARMGVVDFAVLDATKAPSEPVVLRHSGTVLEPGQQANPMVFVANYVLDSLPQEVLRFDAGSPSFGTLKLSIRREDAYDDEADEDSALGADSDSGSPTDAGEGDSPVADASEEASSAGVSRGHARTRRAFVSDKQRAAVWRRADAKVPGLSEDALPADVASLAGKLILSWGWQPTDAEELAELLAAHHPQLPGVVQSLYADDPRFSAARAVLVPVGGARMLQRCRALSGGRYMLLAMDKGHVDARTILEADEHPHVAEHGALSFMANFHCLAALHSAAAATRPAAGAGAQAAVATDQPSAAGEAVPGAARRAAAASTGEHPAPWPRPVCLRTEQSDGLVKAVLLASGLGRADLRSATREFKSTIVEGSPDDIAQLHRGVKAEVPKQKTPLHLATAVLRLAACDPDVFFKFRDVFIERAAPAVASVAAQTDVRADAEAVLTRHYHIHSDKDVAFEVGRVCMATRDYGKALFAFQASEALCGRHHVTLHNQGICHYFLKNYPEALRLFEESLEVLPTYASSQVWVTRTAAAIEDETKGMTPHEVEELRAMHGAAVEEQAALHAAPQWAQRHDPGAAAEHHIGHQHLGGDGGHSEAELDGSEASGEEPLSEYGSHSAGHRFPDEEYADYSADDADIHAGMDDAYDEDLGGVESQSEGEGP
ncbi:hypothetical protein FNF27_05256 [Cafeteria roenbergensis]|uniref:Uncharacterized protein n=1 Tax=Cafeteria roenbergensis TaxID=33653 RepID=A0A5A8E6J5_CAFRO|nr:hypothetical protein FNF27_05256 [Cafeteria roenbergensis]